ncbi:MAG: hypothetical protein GX263_08685 [Firmicutes bacterium]|nr:hypothetical protein [Bacillota bacterium]
MFKELLEDFFYIFNFKKKVPHLIQSRNIWHGLLVYQAVNLLLSLAAIKYAGSKWEEVILALLQGLNFTVTPEITESIFSVIPLTALLINLAFGPLCFLLMVAVFNLTAELFGGTNGLSGLGAILGYGHSPYLFAAIGLILTRNSALYVTGILLLLIFLWSLGLKIAGLKQVYGFSWGLAVLVYLMPAICFLVALTLFLLLAIVFLIPLVMQSINVSSFLTHYFMH